MLGISRKILGLSIVVAMCAASGCNDKGKNEGGELETPTNIPADLGLPFSDQEKAELSAFGATKLADLPKAQQQQVAKIIFDHLSTLKILNLKKELCSLKVIFATLDEKDICEQSKNDCINKLKGKTEQSELALFKADRAKLETSFQSIIASKQYPANDIALAFDAAGDLSPLARKWNCASTKQEIEKASELLATKFAGKEHVLPLYLELAEVFKPQQNN